MAAKQKRSPAGAGLVDQAMSAQVAKASAAADSKEQLVPRRITSVVKVTAID
jgi:hypothetical protein